MEGEIALEKIYKLDVQKCVQQGIFGTVLRGIDRNTKTQVHIKSIDCIKKAQNVKKDLDQLSSKLEHPCIIPLLKVCGKENIVWTVHGNEADVSLVQRLSNSKKLELDDTLRIIHQLVSAVNFLHGCTPQILHTDIQLSNIYLRTGKNPIVLLAGCGETEVLRTHGVPRNGSESEYRAPEVIAEDKHTAMSDVFSVGAVMMVLILQDGFTYPRSDNARSKGINVSIGVEMHHRNTMGLEEITVVAIKEDDRPMVKFCKQLIVEMTKYKPRSRIALGEVEPLFEQVTENKILAGKEAVGMKLQKAEAKPLIEMPPKSTEPVTRRLESLELVGRSNDDESKKGGGESRGSRKQSVDPLAAILALAGLMVSPDEHGPVDIGDYGIFAPTPRLKMNVKSQIGDEVDKYLGAAGQLIENHRSRHFRVQFADGVILNIEDSLMQKLPGCPWKFRKGELVQISSDKSFVKRESNGHGEWAEKMLLIIGEKGVVRDVDKQGDIYVNGLNGLSWWLNPSVLTKVTGAKEDIHEECFVTITIDFVRLRKVQSENEIWDDNMQKVIGELGQVKKIYSNDICDLETGIGMHKYHLSVISFVAEDDEIGKLIYLREQYERKELQQELKEINSKLCVIS